jgi:hypothetical protein
MADGKTLIATGTAQWAKVLPHQMVTNDPYRDYSFWSIDLEVDDKEKERLAEENIKPYKDSNTFKFLLKEKNGKGVDNEPPRIVDAAKRPWSNGEIGNGSQVNVMFYAYPHKASDMHGWGKQLKAVQVVEHVPYAGNSNYVDFDVEGDSPSTDEF